MSTVRAVVSAVAVRTSWTRSENDCWSRTTCTASGSTPVAYDDGAVLGREGVRRAVDFDGERREPEVAQAAGSQLAVLEQELGELLLAVLPDVDVVDLAVGLRAQVETRHGDPPHDLGRDGTPATTERSTDQA